MGSKHQDSDGKNTHCDASKQEPKDQIGHVMIATAIFYIIYGLEWPIPPPPPPTLTHTHTTSLKRFSQQAFKKLLSQPGSYTTTIILQIHLFQFMIPWLSSLFLVTSESK